MDTEQDVIDIGQIMGLGLEEEEEELELELEGEVPVSLNDQLEHFRQQWREELYLRKRRESSSTERAYLEEQARECFMTGSKLEQEGSLYQAIQFYKHAMRMVPDIEHLIKLDFIAQSPRERQTSESSVDSFDGELGDEEVHLASRFQDLQLDQQGWCCPVFQQRACHISTLPAEVMIYILKWVVSSQLDMKSLENVAKVCRGFYLFARDDELWRLACYRIWSSNTGKMKKFGSWRNMYIERPHLQFTGCYISKITYYRQGERSLEQCYDPWHTVEYFRYIRFFAEGKVLMMTSADAPTVTLPKLRNPNSELAGMMNGVYRLSGNVVTCVLKRVKIKDSSNFRYKRNKNQLHNDKSTQTFHLDLEISDSGKRSCRKLTWKSYSVHTLYKGSLLADLGKVDDDDLPRSTGEETVSEFELSSKNYPPLMFSRVKSFALYTDCPLTQ